MKQALPSSSLRTETGGITDPTAGQYYLWSLYWALTTLTTVGYGDITPASDAERVYSIFALLIGALIFGFMISQVSGQASIFNPLDSRLLPMRLYTAIPRLYRPPMNAVPQVGTLISSLDRQAALIEEKLDGVKEYAASRHLSKPVCTHATRTSPSLSS